MMKRFLVLIFTLAIASSASADSYRRLVNFEWEPIDGASKYDLEIQQKSGGKKVFKFKVETAAWNGKLAPGSFEMKVRALDYRGVPGDWSPESPFDVGLDNVKIISPAAKAKVASKDQKETNVDLKWDHVAGSTGYQVEIASEDGEFKKADKVKEDHWTVELPVAKGYTWKVQAVRGDNIKSDDVTSAQFGVLGGKIPAPKIEKHENDFVRDIKWDHPENAKAYDVGLQRFDPKTKKWEKTAVQRGIASDGVQFDPAWPGGTYRVQVKAKGDNRVDSDASIETFKVRDGDRSPAAEFNHEVRKSVDRINGWYGIASYLITMVNYVASDVDHNKGVAYNAAGGTGRLGAGWFKENRDWGFLGIVDMSGFQSQTNGNVTSISGEFSGVWRKQVGDRGEFRSQVGGYYKEHSVVIGDTVTNTVAGYDHVTVAGPQASAEYWYSLTPKMGLQANVHIYYSMLGLKTPNGLSNVPEMSEQLGLLGSYRLSQRWTGLVGLAHRDDKVEYKSNTAMPKNVGQNNSAELTGNYLNFYAEYSF